ncbi:Rv2578c family radical SAM protein [Jiangella mangrovi]|uniref:DNA repair photolyase n=1 Tax=Jiangella mangrovi TaxID=1524084 RepID=A0A7W9GS50_9ACTN|nr:Rv2578c family radical SAM protein [Jiangella mangrovi]MBB5789050.1 DNA repair photolyase [Jiangella mangrovi]
MRWEGQELAVTDGAALPGLQRIAGLVRSVRTPEFEGITFHEVTSKSALNKVPEASHVPFRWTVNPYRGCSHACTYCLSGYAPITMSDGSTVPLARVRPGDQVLGTRVDGLSRRLVRTQVLDHWRTSKPAFRLELDGGTSIVASGDHRFLTPDGWKHVAAAAEGEAPRPHLTTRDRLVGLRRGVVGAAVRADQALTVSYVRPMDVELPMFDLTTGTGDFIAHGVVSHNCFARNTHTYLDLDAGDDFDRQVIVKVNVAEVLQREVGRRTWAREHVAMGTNTDPYQRAEGRYRLMPGIIGALAGSGTPFSILTKGTLLRRDLPLLQRAAQDVEVGIGVSLALLDEGLHKSVEPGTPTPKARLDLIRAVRAAGLPCTVLLAPILPGLTDSEEHLSALVQAVADAGATGISYIPLHLRPGAREWYLGWLESTRPDLLPLYRRLYHRGSYSDQRYRDWLRARVEPHLRQYRLRDDDEEPLVDDRRRPLHGKRWGTRLTPTGTGTEAAAVVPGQDALF